MSELCLGMNPEGYLRVKIEIEYANRGIFENNKSSQETTIELIAKSPEHLAGLSKKIAEDFINLNDKKYE